MAVEKLYCTKATKFANFLRICASGAVLSPKTTKRRPNLANFCAFALPQHRSLMILIDLTGPEDVQFDFMAGLPAEMLQEIAGWLEPLEHVAFGLTSKRMMVEVLGLIGPMDENGNEMPLDLTNMQFEQNPVERRQLQAKGFGNRDLYDAIAGAIAWKAGWAAVILGNVLWNTKSGLDLDYVVRDMVEEEAWTMMKLFSREDFFQQYTFASTTLSEITDFETYQLILNQHRIKWTRGSCERFWSWATPEQIAYITSHPCYARQEATKRARDVALDESEPLEKRLKALAVFTRLEKLPDDKSIDMLLCSPTKPRVILIE